MYVVTFYSYKGGVGRTMALANVAYLLAKAGKRVLAVDFDLEAPGLSSYGPFRCAEEHPGLVEFVLEYLDSNVAPDVSDYIMECRAGEFPIWVMPAGKHTEAGYAAKFSSIRWQELYAEREGFLLFEDIKQQWAGYGETGFDYVLIDSRTGHTDIGGICTRQLPDAVVVQFLPTAQNIEGLRPIVRAIRQEGAPVRRDRVRLHFCPSNLPDLDDQELILQRLLETASSELRYHRSAAEIRHYRSLDLLQQPLYAMTHPQTRLAKEYETLRTAIVRHNLTDRDGALVALEAMRDEFLAARKANERSELDAILTDAALIQAQFPQDEDIAWDLAALANAMTRPEDELSALNVVLEVSTSSLGPALLRRANARATLDDREGALEDLTRLLTQEAGTPFEVNPASELLRALVEPHEWRAIIEKAALNERLDENARGALLRLLMTERPAIPRVVELSGGGSLREKAKTDFLRNTQALVLMADGRFEEAMGLIGPRRSRGQDLSMADLFNFAICEWAVTGVSPRDLFDRVLALSARSGRSSDPNGLQCFALCRYQAGQPAEALEDLRMAQMAARRVTSMFSCWRYLTVSSREMQEDLDEMTDLFTRGVPLKPPGREGLKGANAGNP